MTTKTTLVREERSGERRKSLFWFFCLLLGADYRIASSEVFNDLMVFVLQNIDRIFNAHLGRTDEDVKAHKRYSFSIFFFFSMIEFVFLYRFTRRGPKWERMQPMLKSFVANLTHLLTNVTGIALSPLLLVLLSYSLLFAEATMLRFILNNSVRMVPFIGLFQQVAPKFLRTVVKLWSTSEDSTTRMKERKKKRERDDRSS